MLLKNKNHTLDHKIWEFDFWVTPSIVDVRNTARFRLEMQRIIKVLDVLAFGDSFGLDESRFSANLVDRVNSYLNSTSSLEGVGVDCNAVAEDFLLSFSALLFLVTGKSDNNNKCQFPIYLRSKNSMGAMPILKIKKKRPYIIYEPVARILDADSYMARVARVSVAARQQNCDASLLNIAPLMLLQFVEFLLADEASRKQLSAYLHH